MTADRVINIVVAGLGGQGVLKSSDILAAAAFEAGFDVKKSELHGMSQRGGSVSSDVRYGREVHSPMIPLAEADFLVVLTPDQVEPNRHRLREGGVLLTPADVDESLLPNRRSLNVALLGALSRHLELPEAAWQAALAAHLPPKHLEPNLKAFRLGRGEAGGGKV